MLADADGYSAKEAILATARTLRYEANLDFGEWLTVCRWAWETAEPDMGE